MSPLSVISGCQGAITSLSQSEEELADAKVGPPITTLSIGLNDDDLNTINERSMSQCEEIRSAHEKAVTPKEKLRALNEVLPTLNEQLRTALELQSKASNHLQNALNNANFTTLFRNLEIKDHLFTPVATSLYGISATDVDRPPADLTSVVKATGLGANKGSIFVKETPISKGVSVAIVITAPSKNIKVSKATDTSADEILVIEEDSVVLGRLNDILLEAGYRVAIAKTFSAALSLIATQAIRPDLILTDYNLRDGVTGLEAKSKIWEALNYKPPTVILTGEISAGILTNIASHKCCAVYKPIRTAELTLVIKRLLKSRSSIERRAESSPLTRASTIYIVDDDISFCSTMGDVLAAAGHYVEIFSSAESFLTSFRPNDNACLLVNAVLSDMSGLELIQKLERMGSSLPAIVIAGKCDVPLAVLLMKAGAIDVLQKPLGSGEFLACITRALQLSRDQGKRTEGRKNAVCQIERVTERQREIMDMILAGHPNKNIAADLGISQRTVENHRASIMKRTGVKSLAALVRLTVTAAEYQTSKLPQLAFVKTL